VGRSRRFDVLGAPRAASTYRIALLEKRGHVFMPDKNKVFEGQTSAQPSRHGRIRIAVAAGRHNRSRS